MRSAVYATQMRESPYVYVGTLYDIMLCNDIAWTSSGDASWSPDNAATFATTGRVAASSSEAVVLDEASAGALGRCSEADALDETSAGALGWCSEAVALEAASGSAVGCCAGTVAVFSRATSAPELAPQPIGL